MSKNKKGKGSGKNTPKRGTSTGHASIPKTFAKSSQDARGSDERPAARTFTMRDAAARASDNPTRAWSWEPNLRHKSMSFVKSGLSSEQVEKSKSEGEPDSPTPDKSTQGYRAGQLNASALPTKTTELRREVLSSPQVSQIDGRSPSPPPSDSSDEVVVFTGRKSINGPKLADLAKTPERSNWDDTPGTWVHRGERIKRSHDEKVFGRQPTAVRPRPSQTQDPLPTGRLPEPVNQSIENGCPKTNEDDGQISSLMRQTTLANTTSLGMANSQGHVQAKTAGSNAVNMKTSKSSGKNEMLQDYIENMRESGMLEQIKRTQRATDHGSIAEQLLNKEIGGWAKSDLEDLADLSTSDEVQGDVSQILSKRHRAGEVQYLVVWEGCSPDEAKWIRRSGLTMDDAQEKIESFEREELQIEQYRAQAGEDSDEEADAAEDHPGAGTHGSDDDTDTDGEWEDELEDDFDPGLSDEQIARLLAKQEELGFGSDQLILLDDDFGDESEEGGEHDGRRDAASRPSRNRRERKRKWRVDRVGSEDDELFGTSPAQSFDPMDWERPSLQKHKSQPPAFDISDSELESHLQSTWSKDRQKKKAIKQEREELRAQGLLGNRDSQKLSSKYRNGFSVEQFRNELADFLDDDDREGLQLPPLDKRERKLVHEFANVFNCKSKSSGSGRNRYPVIYKTKRSIDFEDRLFNRVERKLGRQAFGGLGGKPKAARPGRSVGGRGSVPGLNYREGEKVGAGASEIGAENRGRAMLEKMGWSKGTALGAVNNKGILMPIEHIVKTSRAGLG